MTDKEFFDALETLEGLEALENARNIEALAHHVCDKNLMAEAQYNAVLISLDLGHPHADVTTDNFNHRGDGAGSLSFYEHTVEYHPVHYDKIVAWEVVNALLEEGYLAYSSDEREVIGVVDLYCY